MSSTWFIWPNLITKINKIQNYWRSWFYVEDIGMLIFIQFFFVNFISTNLFGVNFSAELWGFEFYRTKFLPIERWWWFSTFRGPKWWWWWSWWLRRWWVLPIEYGLWISFVSRRPYAWKIILQTVSMGKRMVLRYAMWTIKSKQYGRC